jgi:hypothetical protein
LLPRQSCLVFAKAQFVSAISAIDRLLDLDQCVSALYRILDVDKRIAARDWGALERPAIRFHGQPEDESKPTIFRRRCSTRPMSQSGSTLGPNQLPVQRA